MTALEHFHAMHAWWVARRNERDPIGKPWAPRKSTAPTPAEQKAALPVNRDEGRTASNPARFTDLRARVEALPAVAVEQIQAWQLEAQRAGVAFHPTTETERRYHIISGLCTLAEHDCMTPVIVRALLALTFGQVAHYAANTVGAVIGSLGMPEARTFADHCATFVAGNGELVASFDDDGQMSLEFTS